jgi:N-acyl-D-amino-acid deacylase
MRGDYKPLYFLMVLVFTVSLSSCTFLEKPYDLVIKNATITDGTGNPWFKTDIGLNKQKIIKIGFIDENQAKKTINAANLIVSPGFIDIHTHYDRQIAEIPTVDNYIYQGVTTVIGGDCGGHPFPLGEYFKKIEALGISLNFGCLIGHNTIRRKVMEFKMEAPKEEEVEKMKALVDEEMRAGALGFSTGLSYLPGMVLYGSGKTLGRGK